MNTGTIFAVLILAAYIAFEAFTISKVAYRVEPVYIFERFVAYERAMTRCGQAEADTQQRFTRNRAVVRIRAAQKLADQQPTDAPGKIDSVLDEAAAAQESEVDALIEELGCDDTEIRMLMRGYENRARLNLNAPEQAPERRPAA